MYTDCCHCIHFQITVKCRSQVFVFIKKLALSAIFNPAKYPIETNEARNNRCQRLNAQQIGEMLPVLSEDTSARPDNNFKTMQQ